jgi:hypothetical protein
VIGNFKFKVITLISSITCTVDGLQLQYYRLNK